MCDAVVILSAVETLCTNDCLHTHTHTHTHLFFEECALLLFYIKVYIKKPFVNGSLRVSEGSDCIVCRFIVLLQ